MAAPRKYPIELRERVMRLVAEAREQDPELSLNAAVVRIGQRTGVNADTLRGWCKQAAIDRGERPGTTTSDAKRIKELERENQELKWGQRDFVGGQLVFRAGARPAFAVVIAFVDDDRDRFGVAPICRVLTEHGVPIASNSYYAHKRRAVSSRSLRDEPVLAEIERVHADPLLGRGLYGVRKMHAALARAGGVDGAPESRRLVERLMRAARIQGARRGRRFVTTRPDTAAARPPDLVQRVP